MLEAWESTWVPAEPDPFLETYSRSVYQESAAALETESRWEEDFFGPDPKGFFEPAQMNYVEPNLPVDPTVARPPMADWEIQQIIDDYNRSNGGGPYPGIGGGGGSGQQVQVPLEDLACEDLDYLEGQLEQRVGGSRESAIAFFTASGDFFRGEEVYGEIYKIFVRMDGQGIYDETNAVANVYAAFEESRDVTGLLATSLRALGINVGIEYAAISAVETAFRAQRELDRVNSEQERRGSCG